MLKANEQILLLIMKMKTEILSQISLVVITVWLNVKKLAEEKAMLLEGESLETCNKP